MNSLDRLRLLQTRIREAKSPNRELDALLYGFSKDLTPRDSFWGITNLQFVHPDDATKSYYVPIEAVPHYTTDPDGLGACVALMNEVLPGTLWTIGEMEHGPFCRLLCPGKSGAYHDGPNIEANWEGSVTLALLDAIVSAKISEEESSTLTASEK